MAEILNYKKAIIINLSIVLLYFKSWEISPMTFVRSALYQMPWESLNAFYNYGIEFIALHQDNIKGNFIMEKKIGAHIKTSL